jgi:hypothetical protein
MSDVTRQRPRARRRNTRPLIRACRLTLAVVGLGAATMGFASNAAQPLPVAESLLKAAQNDADWLLPAKTYSGNRYTALLNRKTGKVVHRLALNDQTGLDTQPVVVGEAGNQQTPNLPKAQGSRVITTCAPGGEEHARASTIAGSQ